MLGVKNEVVPTDNGTTSVNEFERNWVKRDRGSSVGIATRYGLDGPRIESRLGAEFSSTLQTGPGVHPASHTIKRPGPDVDNPRPCSVEVKERVQLYIYSPSGPSWSVLGWTFYFLLFFPPLSHDKTRNNCPFPTITRPKVAVSWGVIPCSMLDVWNMCARLPDYNAFT